MYWEDSRKDGPYVVPDTISDLSFSISCKMLPLDHAHAFSHALQAALPWLADEPQAGVHLIHGAESGNGWFRPEHAEGELLHLSRRARMALRLPKERIDDARVLEGMTLDVDGFALTVGKSSVKPLSTLPTLFARYVVAEPDQDEGGFLDYVVREIRSRGIPLQKAMCGKSHQFTLPTGTVTTRSVMLADLQAPDSVRLQQEGLGDGRMTGFGLFLPHKGVNPVGDESEKSHFSGT